MTDGLEIKQDYSLSDLVEQLSELCSDLRPYFNLAASDFYKQNKKTFMLKGKGKYKDLSEKYKILKLRKWGFVYPILKASGDIEKSITNQNDSNAVSRITETEMELGTSVSYAIYHHSRDLPRTVLPRRPLWFYDEEGSSDYNRWVRMFSQYVMRETNRVTRRRLRFEE